MNCNNCGKEHALVYPESVNTRLRDKGICIECERWIDLIDEIQVNPEHLIVNGFYVVVKPEAYEKVVGGNFFSFIKNNSEFIFSKSLMIVGRPPKNFKGFFPTNAQHVQMED